MWALLAISYAALTAVHTLVLAKVIRVIKQSSLFVFINSLFCLVGVSMAFACTFAVQHHWPHIKPLFWPYIGLAALTQVIGLRLVVNAYAIVDVSQVAPLGVLTPALVALLALPLLHESLTVRMIIGLIMIIAGAYVLEVHSAKESLFRPFTLVFQRNNPASKAIRGYQLARLLWVSFPVFLKLALENMSPLSPYLVSVITIGCMSIITLPIKREQLSKVPLYAKQLFWFFVLSALIVTLQQFAEVGAYARGNVAAVSALFKLEIPLAILLNGHFFNEEHRKTRFASGLIVCIGAIFMSI